MSLCRWSDPSSPSLQTGNPELLSNLKEHKRTINAVHEHIILNLKERGKTTLEYALGLQYLPSLGSG